MKLTLKDICKKTGGTLVGGDMTVTNLVTDSRKVTDGCIFAVIKGERVDAIDFVPALDSTKNCAYLTDREIKNVNNPYILVDDVIRAIGDIAALHLDTIPAKHIAITGSVGKTTTKEFVYAVLNGETVDSFSFKTDVLAPGEYYVDLIQCEYDGSIQIRHDILNKVFAFQVEENEIQYNMKWNKYGWGPINFEKITVR